MQTTKLLAVIIVIMLPLTGYTQMAGHNTKGDMGMFSGTQPPAGFYVAPMLYDYSADTVRDKYGDKFAPLDGKGSVSASAGIVGLIWVTEKKFLGGNYSFTIWPGVTNNVLEVPALATQAKAGTGLADLYIQPINLGWNKDRADFVAGLGIYAPPGSYDTDSDANRGLGMWSYELYSGTTVYFDEAKTWSLAAFGALETHSSKEGSKSKVGNIFTLEGGLGKSFMGGTLSVGVAYYAQWKLTNDDFDIDFSVPGGPIIGKHRVYGIGPEITLPIASKKTLFGFLNIRYLLETGSRTTLEGNTIVATFSLPIPSVPLQ